MKNAFKKIVQEPLVHFVVLGALIFIAYHFFSKDNGDPRIIVITKGEIASIRSGYMTTWGRQPTEKELEDLIHERLKQEVYCREAVALGLDKNDLIIERRLKQKLEFIVNDNLEETNPGDSSLTAIQPNHANGAKFTFRQVFLDSAKHAKITGRDVNDMLEKLNSGQVNFRKISDITLLPPELSDARTQEIANQFGDEFTLQLKHLPVGKWQGPVKSTYGEHLVQVTMRDDAVSPSSTAISEGMNPELQNDRRKQANEKFYQDLLKNYEVKIEQYKY